MKELSSLFSPQAKLSSITNAHNASNQVDSNESSLDSKVDANASKTTNAANAENPNLAAKTTNENPNSDSEFDATIAPPKTSSSFSDKLKAKAMNYMMNKMTSSKEASPDAEQDSLSNDSAAPRQLTPIEKAKASKAEPNKQPSSISAPDTFKSPDKPKTSIPSIKSAPISKPPSFKMPRLR